MTCEEARENLAEFTVGALDETTRGAVRAHLSECADCRREHDELLATARLLDTAELLEPSRDLWPEVKAALGEREAARAPWWQLDWLPRPRWAIASGAAAAAAVAAIALAVLLPHAPEHPRIPMATDEDAALFTQWNAGAALQGGFADARAVAVLLHGAAVLHEEEEES